MKVKTDIDCKPGCAYVSPGDDGEPVVTHHPDAKVVNIEWLLAAIQRAEGRKGTGETR